VVASSEKTLQRLVDNISRVTEDYGMNSNVKKTKVMCICAYQIIIIRSSWRGKSKVKIYIDGRLIEQVQQFRCLGSLTTEDGYCDKMIRSRIGLAKAKFIERKKILTDTVSLDLRNESLNVWCGVWPCMQQRLGQYLKQK